MLKNIQYDLKNLNTIFFGLILFSPIPCQAQISSDFTLETRVNSSDSIHFKIGGGQQAGENLFHSFSEFSVPKDGSAIFENSQAITNIFSRITGKNISRIDGELQTQYNANLFLLNPNGIQFGPNANLQVSGSFIASTSESILFTDGTHFGTTNPSMKPLLTMTSPIGLQFGQHPGPILVEPSNRAQRRRLVSAPGQTLALIGGDITLNAAIVRTPQGRLELGSINNAGMVALTSTNNLLSFDYTQAPDRGTISLVNGASLGLSPSSLISTIRVVAKDIKLASNSFIFDNVSRPSTAGTIKVPGIDLDATDSISVENGILETRSRLSDTPGKDILLNAPNIDIGPNGIIRTFAVNEASGNININADHINVNAGRIIAQGTRGETLLPSGTILIDTQTLSLTQGGIITAPTGRGGGKDILIYAQESLLVDGRQSEIAARASLADGGTIMIKAAQLSLFNGGKISTSTFRTGQAGTVTIDVTGTILVSGQSPDARLQSAIFSQSPGQVSGDAGSVNITANRLILEQGGEVSVGAVREDDPGAGDRQGLSTGNAGELNITAHEFIQVQGSRLDENGEVQPSALIAEAQGPGSAGNLNLTTPFLYVLDSGEIRVRSLLAGQAGNVNVLARQVLLNQQANVLAETESGEGGNITFNVQEILSLQNESNISASGVNGTDGDGGNINIQTALLIASPLGNSDITTTAFTGNGGNINIVAQGVFGLQIRERLTNRNDITASSLAGTDGMVILNLPEADPSDTLTQLPDASLPNATLSQGCLQASIQQDNRFLIIRRGGVPAGPDWPQIKQRPINQLAISVPSSQAAAGTGPIALPVQSSGLIEAQGWSRDTQGKVTLIADRPFATARVTQSLGCKIISKN